MKPRLRFLSDDLIEQILDEAYGLLETRGVTLQHESLAEQLAGAGCLLDGTGRIRMPRAVVEASIKAAPSRTELWDIAGANAFVLAGDNVHFTPGSTAIKMLDAETRRMRAVTTADMLRCGQLVEQLDAIDFASTAVVPSDVPKAIGDSIRLYALLKTTSKPIVSGAFTIEGCRVMVEMQIAVRGTSEALRAKPFAVFSCCPSSPMHWSTTAADNAATCAELGIPVEIVAMPMAGLVSPISLVGCVIQHTVETLSGIVITQTVRPGSPVLYGGSPGTFDMRTMAATVSTVEAQLIGCAYVEIGKYLGLPTQAYMGLSDSKSVDAQAGFESGAALYLAALCGVNSVSGPGMHYFESCQSLEKLVFDAQICDIARRLAAGLEPREDFPAGQLFDQLLREKNLLAADHTLKHLRLEHCITGSLIDRSPKDEDSIEAHDLVARCHHEVQRHLNQYESPAILSAEQCRDLEEIMTHAAGDFKIGF